MELLVVGLNPKETLAKIDLHFKLKPGSVESPTRYLGADVGTYTCANGKTCWYLSSNTYVKAAIQNPECGSLVDQERGQVEDHYFLCLPLQVET